MPIITAHRAAWLRSAALGFIVWIIGLVALRPDWAPALLLLGALVVVRTMIGWTLAVEVEGRWPWQRAKEPRPAEEIQENPTQGLQPPEPA